MVTVIAKQRDNPSLDKYQNKDNYRVVQTEVTRKDGSKGVNILVRGGGKTIQGGSKGAVVRTIEEGGNVYTQKTEQVEVPSPKLMVENKDESQSLQPSTQPVPNSYNNNYRQALIQQAQQAARTPSNEKSKTLRASSKPFPYQETMQVSDNKELLVQGVSKFPQGSVELAPSPGSSEKIRRILGKTQLSENPGEKLGAGVGLVGYGVAEFGVGLFKDFSVIDYNTGKLRVPLSGVISTVLNPVKTGKDFAAFAASNPERAAGQLIGIYATGKLTGKAGLKVNKAIDTTAYDRFIKSTQPVDTVTYQPGEIIPAAGNIYSVEGQLQLFPKDSLLRNIEQQRTPSKTALNIQEALQKTYGYADNKISNEFLYGQSVKIEKPFYQRELLDYTWTSDLKTSNTIAESVTPKQNYFLFDKKAVITIKTIDTLPFKNVFNEDLFRLIKPDKTSVQGFDYITNVKEPGFYPGITPVAKIEVPDVVSGNLYGYSEVETPIIETPLKPAITESIADTNVDVKPQSVTQELEQSVYQRSESRSIQKQSQNIIQSQIQGQDTKTKTIFDVGSVPQISTPRIVSRIQERPNERIIRPPIIPKVQSYENSFISGFSVFVRERGVFRKQRGVFSKKNAIAFGSSYVAGSSAATFKLVPTSNKPNRFFGGSSKIQDFYSKGDLFIEKPSKRINTFGELRGITFKGIAASRNKKNRRLKL